MKNNIQLVLLSLLLSLSVSAQESPESIFAKLEGKWECKTRNGIFYLEFRSPTSLIFDSSEMSCELFPDIFRVNSPAGLIDYPYVLQDDKLVVEFPDDYRLQFTRPGGYKPPKMYPIYYSDSAGANYLLEGKFCNWYSSSSANYGASEGSTRSIWFYGDGRFSWRSEISPDSGGNTANSGTYSVRGTKVYMVSGNGSEAEAEIHLSLKDGTIMELMFEGKLLGKQLCE